MRNDGSFVKLQICRAPSSNDLSVCLSFFYYIVKVCISNDLVSIIIFHILHVYHMEEIQNTPKQEAVKKKKAALIPASDMDLAGLASRVLPNWRNSNLPLNWVLADEMETKINTFSSAIRSKSNTQASRLTVTQRLLELEKTMNGHISYLKGYIQEAFDKDKAPTFYRMFGLEKLDKKGSYLLPKDREFRVEALERMVSQLDVADFRDRTYGYNFWKPLLDEYKELKKDANQADSSMTASAQEKRILRKEIRQWLQSIVYLIRAHYPDEVESRLRTWGFHKEKN